MDDKQLAIAIQNGEISKAEVEQIWALTSDLSPQTPITVRRALIGLRNATKNKPPLEALALAWPLFMDFMMTAMTETQGALMRDESKFAHLVAGTETIVKTLQNVNPLVRHLETLDRRIDDLRALIEERLPGSNSQMPPAERVGSDVALDIETLMEQGPASAEDGPHDNPTDGPHDNPTDEMEEKARAESIGSAWAKPPDQGPLYIWQCPTPGCDYIYKSGKMPDPDRPYVCLKCEDEREARPAFYAPKLVLMNRS